MDQIEKAIADFFDRDRKEAEKAAANEKKQVSINPDSYIAKEIKYQTALLHDILTQLREINEEMKRQGRKCPTKNEDQISDSAKTESRSAS